MTQRLDRSKLDVRVSLGFHESANDTRKLSELVRQFRPHVYLMEDTTLLESERKGCIVAMNRNLKRCRTKTDERGAHLAGLKAKRCSGFDIEEIKLIIDANRLWLHLVEGYTQPQIDEYTRLAKQNGNEAAIATFKALLAGQTEQALLASETALRNFIQGDVIPRNARIVQGFEMLLDELPVMLERVGGAPTVRIAARFGTSHEPVVGALGAAGFNVIGVRENEQTFGQEKLALALTYDPAMPLTEEQRVELLFDRIYYQMIHLGGISSNGTDYSIYDATDVYRHIGGVRGFLELLDALVAKKPADISTLGDLFIDKLREIRRELAQRGL